MPRGSEAAAASDEALASRALIYRGPSKGQGVGSMMRGVAAALVLGARHNRLVCVSWRAFEAAFTNDANWCVCTHTLSLWPVPAS